MEVSKKLVGKRIYGIFTGNNIHRTKDIGIIEFDVVSVGRRYFILKKAGSDREVCYCAKTGATAEAIKRGYSGSGYIFFNSKDEANSRLEVEVKKLELGLYFSPGWVRRVKSENLVKEVYDLLKNHGEI